MNQLENILNKPSLSLEDSKWKIYKTFNDNSEKQEETFINNNIDNIESSHSNKINQNLAKYQVL